MAMKMSENDSETGVLRRHFARTAWRLHTDGGQTVLETLHHHLNGGLAHLLVEYPLDLFHNVGV